MSKGRAIPVDVYDKEGNMMLIEFHTATGEHIIDAVWDETEEQTSENRVAFREWAYKHLQKEGWEILR